MHTRNKEWMSLCVAIREMQFSAVIETSEAIAAVRQSPR